MNILKKQLYIFIILINVQINLIADCNSELFTISSTKNTKIIDFINILSDECSLSIITTDKFTDKKLNKKLNKTNLKNLTIQEILNIILVENNLSYTLKNGLLKISYLTTKTFSIDYILSQRVGSGSTDITLSSSNPASDSTSNSDTVVNTNSNVDTQSSGSSAQSGMKIQTSDEVKFWSGLDFELEEILNRTSDEYKAKRPIINKNAGLITITGTNNQINRISSYIDKLQDKVSLQVLIDVQLLVVTMSKGKTTGIDWKQLYALQNMTIESNLGTGKYTDASSMYDLSSYGTIKAGGSLKEVIKFLKTQGDVNSISNPKVLTLNNQPALITVGTEYFYKTQQSTAQEGSSGGIAATTQSESIQSVFAGVLLDITPEISDDKTITLKINPSLSETNTDMSNDISANRSMPPDLNRRQLSSVVTVKDGNKIVLGGLINTRSNKDINKVPILGDIPIISSLFRHEENTKQVEELVIIIEPHIIHKEKNNLSLSDLGYTGISSDILKNKKLNEGTIQDNQF